MNEETNSLIDTELEVKVEGLVDSALSEIRKKYGKGSVEYKAYHNETHTQEAIENADKIAVRAGVSVKDRNLLKIVMAFHDIDSSSGSLNEINSVEIASEQMKKKGFFQEDIDVVREIILATRYTFDGEGVIHQKVEYTGDHSKAKRIKLLKKIAADADLSTSGSVWNVFVARASSLAIELGISSNTDEKFWKWEASYMTGLSKRGYYTEAARSLFGKQLASNTKKTRILAGLS